MILIFLIFIFAVETNSFNRDQCCHVNCHQNGMIIQEHCDDDNCGQASFLALEDDKVTLTCFSCNNSNSQFNFKWNYSKRNIRETVLIQSVQDGHFTGSQMTFHAANFNQTGEISCTLDGTSYAVYREYFLCSRIPKPNLNCIAYTAPSNELCLNCTVWLDDKNFVKKNSNRCNYDFIVENIAHADTGSSKAYFKKKEEKEKETCFPNCEMDTICFIGSYHIPPNSSFIIIAATSARNLTYELPIPPYRSIYYHESTPRLHNESSESVCFLSMNTFVPFDVHQMDEVRFLYRINVTDDDSHSTTLLPEFNKSNSENEKESKNIEQIFNVSSLTPYRNYSLNISYRFDGSHNSRSFIVKCQTKKTKPSVSVDFSSGSYFKENDEWIIFWKAVPTEKFFGPSFKYTIRGANETRETKNCNYILKGRELINISSRSYILLGCKNDVGFGAEKSFELYPQMSSNAQHKISAINTETTRSVYVQWAATPNATSYIVFWCQSDMWHNCYGGIEWQTVPQNETFLDIKNVTKPSPYVFAVSTCFGEKCSQMHHATQHKRYESRIKDNSIKVHDVTNRTFVIEWALDQSSDYNNFAEYFEVSLLLNATTNDYLHINTTKPFISLSCEQLGNYETIVISIVPVSKANSSYFKARNEPSSNSTKKIQCQYDSLKSTDNTTFVTLLVIAFGFVVILFMCSCVIFTISKIDQKFKQNLIKATENEQPLFQNITEEQQQRQRNARDWFKEKYGRSWSEVSFGKDGIYSKVESVSDDYDDVSNTFLDKKFPLQPPPPPSSPIPTFCLDSESWTNDVPKNSSNEKRNSLNASTYRQTVDYSEPGNEQKNDAYDKSENTIIENVPLINGTNEAVALVAHVEGQTSDNIIHYHPYNLNINKCDSSNESM